MTHLIISTDGTMPDISDLAPGGLVAVLTAQEQRPEPTEGLTTIGAIVADTPTERCWVHLFRRLGWPHKGPISNPLSKTERASWFRGVWKVDDVPDLIHRLNRMFG